MKYSRGFGICGAVLVVVGATVGACGGGGETTASTGASASGTGGGATASGSGGAMVTSSASGMGGSATASGTGGAASSTTGAGTGGMGGTPIPGYDCSAPVGSVPALKLTQVATGLARPVLVRGEPGDNSRVYVLGQKGQIWIIKDGTLLPTPFLDISSVVHQPGGGDERGLLGFAFHPQYAQNGRFFVYYTDTLASPGDQHLAEYKRSAGDPNVADPNVVQTLFVQPDGESNHNGGMIEFSPNDGYLYVGMGDGGGAGDQHGTFGNSQNLSTRWGKLLRLDVDSAMKPYGIPAGNMTMVPPKDANDPTHDGNPSDPATLNGEIWDFGLRNPWRFSFDACTKDLYIGDVGQGLWEEIDVEPAGQGKNNYGWRLTEGNHDFNAQKYSKTGIVAAKVEYAHKKPADVPGTNGRCSIAGGYVYRGSAIPGLRGTYLFGDYCSNEIWTMTTTAPYTSNLQDGTASTLRIPSMNAGQSVLTSFGQDNLGEIYVLAVDGNVFRVDAQ
jgi:glucose/arabinose dehydrogenase